MEKKGKKRHRWIWKREIGYQELAFHFTWSDLANRVIEFHAADPLTLTDCNMLTSGASSVSLPLHSSYPETLWAAAERVLQKGRTAPSLSEEQPSRERVNQLHRQKIKSDNRLRGSHSF